MRKVNIAEISEETWASPKEKFAAAGKEISVALGRKPLSMDLLERHPFDVEICRVPPGKSPYPFHSHSAQWEYYQVLSGTGQARDKEGTTEIATGDAFIFKPGEPHQILNTGSEDLVLLVVADNPIGESCFYPDSQKWLVRSPERKLLNGELADYYAGEE